MMKSDKDRIASICKRLAAERSAESDRSDRAGAAIFLIVMAIQHMMAGGLEKSLRMALGKMGAELVSLRRYGQYRVSLTFRYGPVFGSVEATADEDQGWTSSHLDEWFYRSLTAAVAKKLTTEPFRLRGGIGDIGTGERCEDLSPVAYRSIIEGLLRFAPGIEDLGRDHLGLLRRAYEAVGMETEAVTRHRYGSYKTLRPKNEW